MSLHAAGATTTVPAPAAEAWSLVGGLPERQRTAVVLRHVADLTEPQIARVMRITRGTVSTTLADAHRALRARLAEEDAKDDRG